MTGKSYGERHADWSYCDNWGQVDVLVAEAIAAYRERLRAAVEGLPHVECGDLDCSHDDLSYSQREHPWLDRATVLAIIDEP